MLNKCKKWQFFTLRMWQSLCVSSGVKWSSSEGALVVHNRGSQNYFSMDYFCCSAEIIFDLLAVLAGGY